MPPASDGISPAWGKASGLPSSGLKVSAGESPAAQTQSSAQTAISALTIDMRVRHRGHMHPNHALHGERDAQAHSGESERHSSRCWVSSVCLQARN